jgi:hypothetical protein
VHSFLSTCSSKQLNLLLACIIFHWQKTFYWLG